jgi:metallo-beta-lactamase family protein
MQITFHGAAQTVTGSQHLLELNGKKILLDCGLYVGKREMAYDRNKSFPFVPGEIDQLILSHAHIDHSGNLPRLCQQGFKGNIYSTFATRDLCAIMLLDSAKVQLSDITFANKRRAKQKLPLFKPLYDATTVEPCLRRFLTLDYHRAMTAAPGATLTYLDAGHLLGSAEVLLELEENGRKQRFLFSGDIGRGKNNILRDPERTSDIDILVMESTYGGREHETADLARDELCKVINRVLEKRGKLIIPAFAVGRVQQLVYALHLLREEKCFPAMPIYVDSPLAVNATEVFRVHPECFNQDIYDFLNTHKNPFGWEDVTYIRTVEESMALNDKHEPMIIISSSGMCEAGRILHHLRNNIGDARNTLLFSGYCAPNTLGRRLMDGDKNVRIFGDPFEVRAEVVALDYFSGHADRSELIDYARATASAKTKIFLVHGEVDQAQALQAALQEQKIGDKITIPALHQTVPL